MCYSQKIRKYSAKCQSITVSVDLADVLVSDFHLAEPLFNFMAKTQNNFLLLVNMNTASLP